MEQNRRRIDQVADPTFTAGLETADLDMLRERRNLLGDLDTELSYYRRMLHGRMDLLAFEQSRRTGTETRTLLEALPEILADDGGTGREAMPRELSIEAPQFTGVGHRSIDRVLGDDFLAHLPSIDDEELGEVQAILASAEVEISEQRRIVYDAHEVISGEITRRYREGLADVDELLQNS